MSVQQKSVIVMDSDPQVLKGLVLLLEGMMFNVIPAGNQQELENIKNIYTGCPVLLVLPLVFDNSKSGYDLVRGLRAFFGARIPAILISLENGLSHSQSIDQDVLVLSDQVKPKDLRLYIKKILETTRSFDLADRAEKQVKT